MAIEEGRGLLTDEEREELRQRLAQRRLELQHQQKQLRLLQTHSAASQQEGLSGGGGALMSGSEASDVGKVRRGLGFSLRFSLPSLLCLGEAPGGLWE